MFKGHHFDQSIILLCVRWYLAYGAEALHRFVAREALRRVHEAVFGILALESEPIDRRL